MALRPAFFPTSAFALFLASGAAAVAAEPVKVVATFSVLGDLVRNVGAERVSVTTLVGPDGDTHVYQPTPADARAIASADLVVENGLHFEGWLGRLVEAARFKGKVVVASEGVEVRTMIGEAVRTSAGQAAPGKPMAAPDPHAWQDLRNGRIYVRNIAAALIAVDPAHGESYRANAAAYDATLAALDAQVRREIGALPEAKRKVITTHDAFGYFGAAYGIEFHAPEGPSTESEPSAAEIARLIRQIRREGIKALFIENMTDPRLIQELAREAGAAVGGELYSDALSAPGGPADSYVKMFQHNAAALKAAMVRN